MKGERKLHDLVRPVALRLGFETTSPKTTDALKYWGIICTSLLSYEHVGTAWTATPHQKTKMKEPCSDTYFIVVSRSIMKEDYNLSHREHLFAFLHFFWLGHINITELDKLLLSRKKQQLIYIVPTDVLHPI